MQNPHLRISRRSLLKGGLGLTAVLALARRFGRAPAFARPLDSPHHLVWVWQFDKDGSPDRIGVRLRDYGLGLLLKTHDGVRWMSDFDESPYAVSGPAQVAVLAAYYEDAGIPFHAWCVAKGEEPLREAELAADVLAAGARSLHISVQPREGFWAGSPEAAVAFVNELRRLQPGGRVVLVIDPRPWVLTAAPLNEFIAVADEIAPLVNWRAFDIADDYARFRNEGFPVPPEGVTPEFIVSLARERLGGYGLPLRFAAELEAPREGEVSRFVAAARHQTSDYVSVWRYGTVPEEVFDLLRAAEPSLPPPPPPPAPPQERRTHVIQPGETLSLIAERYGVSVAAIAEVNGLDDPDIIVAGQTLIVP